MNQQQRNHRTFYLHIKMCMSRFRISLSSFPPFGICITFFQIIFDYQFYLSLKRFAFKILLESWCA